MEVTTLAVANLEVCDRTRVRKQRPNANGETVGEYAEAYKCGLITDPLDVFCEPGTERYIVADGEHRLEALRRAKIKKVDVRLHEGDEVAALDFALGCNRKHGVQLTKADRYFQFCRIMDTPELKDKYRTDTELSEKLGVAVSTIHSYKAQWRESPGGDRQAKRDAKKSAEKHASTASPKKNVAQASNSSSKNGSNLQVGGSSEEPTTEVPDSDSMNLSDLKTAIELLAQFPLKPPEAAQKFAAAVDMGRAKDAHGFLETFLGECGQL